MIADRDLRMVHFSRAWVGHFWRALKRLAQVCRGALGEDPFTGAVFVFSNRQRTAVKLLVYDGQGFWLCHKRLSKGRFRWWPTAAGTTSGLEAHELQVLLRGGDPTSTRAAPAWRKLG